MKHKVGDTVKIKSRHWYNQNKSSFGTIYKYDYSFTPKMSTYCGQKYKIEEIHDNYYCLENIDYKWIDEMFEECLFEKGEIIEVSCDNFDSVNKRIFIEYIENSKTPFICVDNTNEKAFKNKEKFDITAWKDGREIEQPQIVELTFEDISNGKGVGIDPKLIRIKK